MSCWLCLTGLTSRKMPECSLSRSGATTSRSQTLFGNAWRETPFHAPGGQPCLAVTQNGVLHAAFPNGVWERVAEWLDGGTPALIAAHLQEPQRLLRCRQVAVDQVVLGPERHAGGPL